MFFSCCAVYIPIGAAHVSGAVSRTAAPLAALLLGWRPLESPINGAGTVMLTISLVT